MATLNITRISITADKKEIVREVSFALPQGKIFVLMGPNGSGKSSLAFGLAGHPRYRITEGSARIGKKDIVRIKPEQKARAGLYLAMQTPPSIPGVGISNFLRLAKDATVGKLTPRLAFRKELLSTAEALRLSNEFLERGLYEGFSGGEKKRLELLELALLKPKFAILDEIDSGLDVDGVALAADQITQAATQGTGILLITHGTRLVSHLVPDRVIIMKSGRIVQEGSRELADHIEKKGYNFITKR